MTYTAVIVLVVALFSVVLIASTASINRTTELYHQREVYRGNLTEVEGILRQMERLASQIVSNNEILGAFIPLDSDGDADNYFTQNLIDAIRVSSLLSSINGTDNDAARISLFNRSGDYVSTGTLYETPGKIKEMLSTAAHYDAIAEGLQQSGQDSLVRGFHEDDWSNNASIRLISLYRTLASYTANVYGMVEIQVSVNAFDRYDFWQGDGMPAYMLVSREGQIIYPLGLASDVEALLPDLVTAVDQAAGGIALVEGKVGRDDVVLMASTVAPSDWLFVRVLKADALMAPYVRGYLVMALACLALLVCLVLVVNYLAIRIAKPLASLAKTVAGVNLTNMQQAMREVDSKYPTSELNALSSAFNRMLTRLDQSVAMEIQAHMRALQSQMNPHFLYNMLSVIIESSEEEGSPRTVSMCMKLSSMLRYIADYDGDTASLAEEIAHTRNYLDLMKDRYEDLFTYSIDMAEGMEGIIVPKMILQPLAENCFSHGFKDCRPPWHIGVKASVADGAWRLTVRDNGTGITEEAAAAIYQRVEQMRSDVATNYTTLKLGGMGLVNTLLRLSLSQNDDIIFDIASSPEGGTVIEIGGRLNDTRIDR